MTYVFLNHLKNQKQQLQKNKNEDIGLSRIVATFDWEYSGNKKEEGTLDVTIGLVDAMEFTVEERE